MLTLMLLLQTITMIIIIMIIITLNHGSEERTACNATAVGMSRRVGKLSDLGVRHRRARSPIA